MREFLACKLASRGDYYWQKGLRPEAQTSYVLAHQLYPANRTIFEILVSQLLDAAERYPWSGVHELGKRNSDGRIVTAGKDQTWSPELGRV